MRPSSLLSAAALVVWIAFPTSYALVAPRRPSATESRGRRARLHSSPSRDGVVDGDGERLPGADERIALSTAVLRISYDGTYFSGFTAGNSEPGEGGSDKEGAKGSPQSTRRQSRRSRTLQRKGGGSGRVRTVDDTLRSALAKLYGNVDPKQIKIEACSRTDAGVHATTLVAQFYCARQRGSLEQSTATPMRPKSRDDGDFLQLPFEADLSKLVFVLNRMLPPDVRVVAAAPPPDVPSSVPMRGDIDTSHEGTVAFHPTLHTKSKTYAYKFAIGSVHDPVQSQYVWHLDGSSGRAVGMNGKRFRLERAIAAAELFAGGNVTAASAEPRDYGAFRAAFRGTDRGRVQSTMCTLWRCEILQERRELLPSWERDQLAGSGMHLRRGSRLRDNFAVPGLEEKTQTYTVVISGDRFLYKMIRNIVGCIVAVGCGHLDLDDVRTALNTGKWGGDLGEDDSDEGVECSAAETRRPIRRICAPARGLTLAEVKYPEEVSFNWQSG